MEKCFGTGDNPGVLRHFSFCINSRNGGNILAPFLNLNLSIQVLVYHPVIVLGRHGELFDVL